MSRKLAIIRLVTSSILAIICLFILLSLMFGKLKLSSFIFNFNTSYSYTKEQTATLGSINKIDLRNFGSETINIYPTDSNELKLIQSSTSELSDTDLVSTSNNNGSLILTKPRKFKFFNIGFYREKIDLYIPKDYANDLSISLSSGKLLVQNLNINNLNVYLSSGSCDLENLNVENIDLRLSSGNLSGTNIGSKSISTDISSGNLNVTGAFSNIVTQTSSGNTKIYTNTVPDSLSSRVSSGRTEIGLPENDGFELRYKKSSGSISSDFPLSSFDKDNKSGVSEYKNGGNSYDISISSGKIVLKKL